MDLRKLKTLIDLVSESNISELEITEADGKVRIVKSEPVSAMHPMSAPAMTMGALAGGAVAAAPVQALAPAEPPAPVGHAVKAPMVGTFYRSSSPGAKAFVEIGVLGQEAVAGMDGLGVGHFGGRDDRRHVEVALRRRRRPDTYRLVGELHVLGVAVGFGIDDDRLDSELAAGPLDTECDLAAVGYQYLLEHPAALTR